MKLSEIPKEDLELMGYDDIALIILQESGKKMKLADIFKKVCKVLELPDSAFESQLMDFFEQMSINKKFTMLDNGYWDLQSRHKANIVIEDNDDEEVIDEIDDEIDEELTDDSENEDIFSEKEEDADEIDDDLSDLMIVDDNEDVSLE